MLIRIGAYIRNAMAEIVNVMNRILIKLLSMVYNSELVVKLRSELVLQRAIINVTMPIPIRTWAIGNFFIYYLIYLYENVEI